MTASPSVTLTDPGGSARATLTGPASPETLLRAALGMTPRDEFMVFAHDDDRWELGVFWVSRDNRLQPLEVQCGHIPDPWVHRNKVSMIESAWLALVDEGWSVT